MSIVIPTLVPPGMRETDLLPSPPTDGERDLYLAGQWRWVTPLSFVGYVLIVISITFFVVRHDWSAALLIPLAFSTAGTLVSLFTSSRKRRDTLESHRAVVATWTPDTSPSVDVFLPSAGEDLAVLANTYRHVANLDWKGDLNVYVLDDSGRESVRELALEQDFHYLSRPNRGYFKKAGNLRYGFDNSHGDLIMILDADFVPRPDALRELVPYFDQSDIGIVQSPQFFDIDSRMNWLQRAAGATQILFYRWVQPSRDRSEAAICVGTSAVYRRAALTLAGGYALIGHSEDVHTGVKMMRVGYRVRYVPTIVTKGLCPNTLDQFMTQQYRWCTGSMSLLFSRDFHRIKMRPMQRLSYWSGFLYYITTAINVFTTALPPILMAWFVSARVTPANYIFVLLALVLRQAVVPIITLQSESLIGLARIQTTYSFCHALALYDTLRRRTDSWVATGAKEASRTSVRVTRLVRRWCVGVQVTLWSAIAWNAGEYGLGRWWLMISFTLLNLYVVFPLVRADATLPRVADARRLVRHAASRVRHANPQLGRVAVRAVTLTTVAKAVLDLVPEPATLRDQPTTLTWLQSVGGSDKAVQERTAA
jgi:cellulose synthase (UDP-forming)